MCDRDFTCFIEPPPPKSHRQLSLLLLDCWQRKYDERPYRYFKFNRLDFEHRLDRAYDPSTDFATIVLFLTKRSLWSVKLRGFAVLSNKMDLLYNFAESLKKLKHIELNLMSLPAYFFELLEANVGNMSVMNLSLEGTPLNDNDILYLRPFAIKSKTLQTLNISSCNINQYNFATLADGIHKSESIISINISRMVGKHLSLDSDKISHIISSLIWQNKLQEINMQNCELISHDMEIIAEYLYRKSSQLVKLNVAFNKIGCEGAQYLLKAISASGTLKYLNMSGCNLGCHGGEIIANYLTSCFLLESLIVQYNNMGPDAVNMILLTMKKDHKLNKLYLFGNKYNTKTGDILKSLLHSKKKNCKVSKKSL